MSENKVSGSVSRREAIRRIAKAGGVALATALVPKFANAYSSYYDSGYSSYYYSGTYYSGSNNRYHSGYSSGS